MSERHFDLIIIGTGSGNSIIGPEHDDLEIAIIEKGVFGGTCLNVGCIPTKMFVYPADVVASARHAHGLGVDLGEAKVDWPAIRDRIFGRIDQIPPAGEAYRESLPHVTVYKGTARFVGERAIDTGTGETITGEQIVVAAGGRPAMMPVEGLDAPDPERGVHTSDTVMRLDSLPPRMAIIGAGFIAAEFAHVFSSFGVDVRWLQRSEVALRSEDASIAHAFTKLWADRGVLQLQTKVTAASYDGGVWTLTTEGPAGESEVEVEAVLVAIGRTPNTDLLDAAAGGLQMHDDGRIVVDEYGRTSVPGVWALGDIASEYQLKHVANHEARIVAHNLTHPDELQAFDHRYVPHAVFGSPQIASFGQTEHQLRDANVDYLVKVQRYADIAYGWAMEDDTGICKVLADAGTGQILGAHVMGYQAAAVIQPLIQAASFGQRPDDVARGQYWIHPAISEVVENALLGLHAPDEVEHEPHTEELAQ
ncbi:mycothione reductase [Blastococcus sp. Marseille-P5729]|uniref:mycothione reductase n=1 Tax=Blastococcus sp. Marseille-P5729 TaxID=2086582 RepID=UPI000D0F4C07|nr:mycothione reductase [Blastococcus sp. Marseille-P5729]